NPEELARLDSLQRELLGPLRCLDRDKKIRIVLDGLDRLSIGAALPTIATVNALVSDADFSNVSLVVTARPDFPLPGAPESVEIGPTDEASITSYLERRAISSASQERIVGKAAGNWLVAR